MSTTSGIVTLRSGDSGDRSGNTNIETGTSSGNQAGHINIKPGMSNGGDGASLVLRGGDTSSENVGLVKLLGGGKGGEVDEASLGLMEINDINIRIRGGNSETDVGGNIDINSGTSTASSSGKVLLSSGMSTTSGIVTLRSGDSDDRSGNPLEKEPRKRH